LISSHQIINKSCSFNVALTKIKMGKRCLPFKIKFMHLVRFVVYHQNIVFSIFMDSYFKNNIKDLISVDVSLISWEIVSPKCFTIIKFHQDNWFICEFEFQKSIRKNPLNLNLFHKRRHERKTNKYWSHYHEKWPTKWND